MAESEVIEKFPEGSKKIFLHGDAIDVSRDDKSLIIPGTHEKLKVNKVLYATGSAGRICPQKRSRRCKETNYQHRVTTPDSQLAIKHSQRKPIYG